MNEHYTNLSQICCAINLDSLDRIIRPKPEIEGGDEITVIIQLNNLPSICSRNRCLFPMMMTSDSAH